MDYQTFAVSLAHDAGQIIKQNFSLNLKTQWKDDQTPLTQVDQQVNDLVVARIKEAFPDHGLLIEETAEIRNAQSALRWVCDPLDGTFPYSHGIPTAMFSLALVENGQPILGVCFDPFLDRLFSATKGGPALLNGQSIQANTSDSLNHNVVGISLLKGAKFDLSPLVSAIQSTGALPLNLASNVYMGALVAAGSLAAVVYNDDKPYDAAALKILVESAGGKVSDLTGQEQNYSEPIHGMLASNGKLHEELLALIKQHVQI